MSSMRGLPSYEEAEVQRKEREAAEIQSLMQQTRPPIQDEGQTAIQTQVQVQPQNQVIDKTKMRERGSMSEPDLVGRFGNISVRFEPGTQTETQDEVGISHSMQSGVGSVQRLHHGEEDDGDEDDMGAGPIQMCIKKVRA